jgi:probable F420-dependent oxidoreductase
MSHLSVMAVTIPTSPKLSVALSNDESDVGPESIVEQARLAERLGYAGVWLPDHLLPPERYGDVYGGVYEPLVVLSHLAAVTERIVLGTTVIIVPLREPVLLAKQLATLERLAPGRVVFGLGIGWEKREFEAIGVPFSERGPRTDAAVDLIRALHDGHPPSTTRFFGSGAGIFEPRPTAPIPLMVGGMSAAAMRRTVRIADRWQAFGLDPDEFEIARTELGDIASPRRISVGIMLARQDARRSAADLVELAARYGAAGADEITIHFGPSAHTSAPMTEVMDRWQTRRAS